MSAFIGNVGDYCVVVDGDTVSVTDIKVPLVEDESTWTVPTKTVKGLGKHVAKGVALRLVSVYDMEIIYIIQIGHKYGSSYAINLTEPDFSEWGDCGIVVKA